MSSPPPPPPPPPPFGEPPPHNCCHCGKPLDARQVRVIAWNASIVYKKDVCHMFCNKTCKENCVAYWNGVCSFSLRSFSVDGIREYTLRSPIPTLYKGIWGMVAFSSYAPEDKENVFISVDGKTRIPLPPTPRLP